LSATPPLLSAAQRRPASRRPAARARPAEPSRGRAAARTRASPCARGPGAVPPHAAAPRAGAGTPRPATLTLNWCGEPYSCLPECRPRGFRRAAPLDWGGAGRGGAGQCDAEHLCRGVVEVHRVGWRGSLDAPDGAPWGAGRKAPTPRAGSAPQRWARAHTGLSAPRSVRNNVRAQGARVERRAYPWAHGRNESVLFTTCKKPGRSLQCLPYARCVVTQTKPGLLPLWDCAAVASATPGGCDLRQHQRNSNSGAHNGRSAALRSPRARPLYVPRTSEMRRCFVWARRVPPCA
jgi:hypothetical protein